LPSSSCSCTLKRERLAAVPLNVMKPARPEPDPTPARPEIRIVPPATSLSALARSKRPLEEEPEPAPPAPERTYKVGGLGRYAVIGGGMALVLAGLFSLAKQNVETPRGDVLHAAPGVKHTPDGKQVRWRKQATTIHIDASVDRIGPRARDAIREAFGAWVESDAHLPQLTFDTAQGTSSEAKPDGKNTVVFAPITLKGHERDLAITLTYSDERTGDILESDIIINENFPFDLLDREPSVRSEASASPQGSGQEDASASGTTGDSSEPSSDAISTEVQVNTAVQTERRSSCVAQQVESSCGRDVYDVTNVVTHEVGHFFGLGEDMTDTSSTMYVCTNRCETHKRKLTATDSSVLAALYPEAIGGADRASVAGCAARFAPAGSPGTGALAALLAGLLIAARRRR